MPMTKTRHFLVGLVMGVGGGMIMTATLLSNHAGYAILSVLFVGIVFFGMYAIIETAEKADQWSEQMEDV